MKENILSVLIGVLIGVLGGSVWAAMGASVMTLMLIRQAEKL